MKPAAPGLCAIVPLLDGAPDQPGRRLGLVPSEYRLELAIFGDGAIAAVVAIQGSATGDLWSTIGEIRATGTDEAVAVQLFRLAHAPHYRAQVVSASVTARHVRVLASRSRNAELDALEHDLQAFEQQREADRQLWREYMDATAKWLADTDRRIAELIAAREKDQRQFEELAALTRREIAQRDELIALIERNQPAPARTMQ